MSLMQNKPVHILLVDDLEENLVALEALLRRDDLIILTAKTGADALELLLKHDVALALLDVQMPGMDGYELAGLMRGIERTRSVPIIFLTAGAIDNKRRFRGYEAGAVDFLFKPIETDILRSKVDVFIELYRQRNRVASQRDALEEMNVKAAQYAQALEDADRRKDDFLATLAHELRNPLAPIRNGLQIMRMSKDGKVSEELRGMMDRQMTHLVRLIDDLLDVSRISKGKIALERKPIKAQTAIKAALEASLPLIESGNHRLNLEISDTDLWINADITRVAQIVTNLINNAAKYTPDGGVIDVKAYRENAFAKITVADNGIGIPEDMLPRVFDLFTQVRRDGTQSQGGLGIGLALVKQLLELQDGSISVKSEGLGHGSAFTVCLPLVEAPAVEEQEVAASPVGEPLRVLVVDDNIDSARTTSWMLEMMDHVPVVAHDGPEAIRMAQDHVPDVILLDIGMPGMNGYEVCRVLRADQQFKNTVMIAQTGWGQEKDRQAARDAGFDHHLVKPVGFDAFSDLLASIKPRDNA